MISNQASFKKISGKHIMTFIIKACIVQTINNLVFKVRDIVSLKINLMLISKFQYKNVKTVQVQR